MSERDGGPAFPRVDPTLSDGSTQVHFGMTLRDYFAAAALPGLICSDSHAAIAAYAYDIADAMLAERARGDKAGEAQQAQERG